MKTLRLVFVLGVVISATFFAATVQASAHSSSWAKADVKCVDNHIVLTVTTHNGENLSQTVDIAAPVSGATPTAHHLGGLAPGQNSAPFVFTFVESSTPGGSGAAVLDWTDGKGYDGIPNTGDDQPDSHPFFWKAFNCPPLETTTTTAPPTTVLETTTTTVYAALIPAISIERPAPPAKPVKVAKLAYTGTSEAAHAAEAGAVFVIVGIVALSLSNRRRRLMTV